MMTKQAQLVGLVRQAVYDMRMAKRASHPQMQKRAFTAVELATMLGVLGAAGYGAYRGGKRLMNNPQARHNTAVGTGIGATAGTIGGAVLAPILKKKTGIPFRTGGMAAVGGVGGGTTGGLLGLMMPTGKK